MCILWQIFKLPDAGYRGFPPRHTDVLHTDPLVLIHVAGVVVHHLPVLDIVDPDLDLVKLVQDVRLGERERGVPVDLTGEPQQRDVEPAASPGPARGYPELSPLLL